MPRKSEIYARALALQNERDALQSRIEELEAENLLVKTEGQGWRDLAGEMRKKMVELRAENEGMRQGIEEFKRRCKT